MHAPRLSLMLFGAFEARYAGRPLTAFATDKIRALLAYLAVESGAPHRRETLAALFWPDHDDAAARRNLRQSFHRLRTTLHEADPALPDRLLTQTRQTIALNPEALDLDAARVAELIRDAGSAPDPVAPLTRIADLYRGELLAGFDIPDAYAFDEWLRIQRELYHLQAVEGLARLIALHEERDEPDEVLAAGARLLALDPWHEQAHRQIMRAYAAKGARARAIAHYNELVTVLERDLGVEPTPTTTALYDQIRTETAPVAPQVSPGKATGGRPRARPAAQRPSRHFPAPRNPLIGRRQELEQLTATLADPACRLLSVVGPGGIGKTSLCLETGRRLAAGAGRFPDGVAFVPLSQLQAGSAIVPAIVQSLDLALPQGRDPQAELLNHLRHKQILLFLDNFEHLLQHRRPLLRDEDELPPAVAFLTEALAAAPGVAFCVTSREPLSLHSEWLFNLDGLPYSTENGMAEPLELPAPQLFIRSARRYRPTFAPETQREAVLEICRLTSGLPLALEMAAAWMRAFDPPEIAARIAGSLDFLTSPFRDTPERQRSIRAIIASTWEQLTPEQQQAGAAMSVFPGPFNAQAALHVAQAGVLDVAILVEKSLLRRVGDRQYALHELVRQYAGEQLVKSGLAYTAHHRHADYFFSWLNEHIPGLNGQSPMETLVTLRRGTDDLRAAWRWACGQAVPVPAAATPELLRQVVDDYAVFLVYTTSIHEGEDAYQRAGDALAGYDEDDCDLITLRSRLAAHLAWFRSGIGKQAVSLADAQQAVALAERCPDPVTRAFGLSILGWAEQITGDFDLAEGHLNEAVALFTAAARLVEASLALVRLGSSFWRKGESERALEYYQQSLAIEQRLQNKRGINRAHGAIGLVHQRQASYGEALDWLRRTLATDQEMGNRLGIIRDMGNIGSVYLEMGDYEQALAWYLETARLEQEAGHTATLAIWYGGIGSAYKHTRRYDLALEYYDLAIAIHQDRNDRYNLCDALLGKGETLLLRGDVAEARRPAERGRGMADESSWEVHRLRAGLLAAGLTAAAGDQQSALDMLTVMLADMPEGDEAAGSRADARYEMWRINRDPEIARQALADYRIAFASRRRGIFFHRIEELEAFLAGLPGG